jgi:Protein of unknown function (DUF3465)
LKKLVAFVGLLGVIYALGLQHGFFDRGGGPAQLEAVAAAPPMQECDGNALATAYRNHQSHVEVCGRGVIAKVLKEDTRGSRHQRFIVRIAPSQTILIAYNLDIAPRIEELRAGAPVEFVGEYEWNWQGGVVHWAHRDPGGRHPSGWIRYEGRQYQ